MRKQLYMTLKVLLLALIVSSQAFATDFSIEKKTAIAIQKLLNGADLKNDEGPIAELSAVLAQDSAIEGFTQMIVVLCQNPKKYDFPAEGIDVNECTYEKASIRVQDDLAYTLVHTFREGARGDQVEDYLNDFLNTYLEKMKAVIEAFNSWM